MRKFNRHDIPPYVRPVYYNYRDEEKRRAAAAKRAPSEWRNLAVFQGLVALGFVALGRASVQNGWPICMLISLGSAPTAIVKSTQALSNYLSLRKQRLQK